MYIHIYICKPDYPVLTCLLSPGTERRGSTPDKPHGAAFGCLCSVCCGSKYTIMENQMEKHMENGMETRIIHRDDSGLDPSIPMLLPLAPKFASITCIGLFGSRGVC